MSKRGTDSEKFVIFGFGKEEFAAVTSIKEISGMEETEWETEKKIVKILKHDIDIIFGLIVGRSRNRRRQLTKN